MIVGIMGNRIMEVAQLNLFDNRRDADETEYCEANREKHTYEYNMQKIGFQRFSIIFHLEVPRIATNFVENSTKFLFWRQFLPLAVRERRSPKRVLEHFLQAVFNEIRSRFFDLFYRVNILLGRIDVRMSQCLLNLLKRRSV